MFQGLIEKTELGSTVSVERCSGIMVLKAELS